MVKVLVVEDEASIREMIALNLRLAGMEAVEADSAEAALPLLEQRPGCDAAILDVMLPGMNGFSLCETIRRTDQKIGIIILSAKGQEQDKIRGLSIGADDYMTKPFSVSELLARVETVLRRCGKTGRILELPPDIRVDTVSRVVRRGEEAVALTAKEFDLLLLFAQNRNIVLCRDRIYERVWNEEYLGDSRTVDLHIQRMRKKLGLEDRLTAVYKVGYRLEG